MKNNSIVLLVGILIVISLASILFAPRGAVYITGHAASGDSYTSFNMSEEISLLVTGSINLGAGRVNANAPSSILDSYDASLNYSPSGYLAFWRFDNANGSNETFAPEEGGKFNGTVYEASNGSTGQVNEAYVFDGVDDYIDVGNSTELNPETFTISAWIYPNSWGEGTTFDTIVTRGWDGSDYASYMFGRGTSDWTGFGLGIYNRVNASGWNYANTGTDLPTGVWSNVVGMYNGTDISLYINGVLNSTVAYTGGMPPYYDEVVSIGMAADWNGLQMFPFNGTIDEVIMYNRSLSSSEVSALYNTYLMRYATNGSWAFNRSYFSIENDGTVNISVNYSADRNAGQFIGGSSPSFKLKGVADEVGACPDLNTTYAEVPNSTEAPNTLCPILKFANGIDAFNVPVRLVIPSDVSAGARNSTITFSAAKV